MNLSEAFDEACSSYGAHGFDALSERHKILVAIWGLEADVNNGGFDQFFYNGSGDLAWFAPQALRAIKADRMASIVEAANSIFGAEGPPPDGDIRQAALFKITDANESAWEALDRRFYEYPDDISELLVTHFGLTSAA